MRFLTYGIRYHFLPFRNVVTKNGLHIHHLVWGILLLLVVGFVALVVDQARWHPRFAIPFGIAAALVIDEFALWLNLRDVYWDEQGRASIDVAILFVVLLGIYYVAERFWRHWIREVGLLARDLAKLLPFGAAILLLVLTGCGSTQVRVSTSTEASPIPTAASPLADAYVVEGCDLRHLPQVPPQHNETPSPCYAYFRNPVNLPPNTRPCRTADLRPEVTDYSPNSTSEGTHVVDATVLLVNESSSPCILSGHPRVDLVSNGTPLPIGYVVSGLPPGAPDHMVPMLPHPDNPPGVVDRGEAVTPWMWQNWCGEHKAISAIRLAWGSDPPISARVEPTEGHVFPSCDKASVSSQLLEFGTFEAHPKLLVPIQTGG